MGGKAYRVAIGVGHGGTDPGAVANGLRESDLNLVMGARCRDILESSGIEVMMTRISDVDSPLADKIAKCNDFAPDVAIEIHNNAGGGDGFEAYKQTNQFADDSTRLAELCESKVKALGQNSRGIKTKKRTDGLDWFGWLRQVECPTVILEGAFLDTKDHEIVDEISEQEAFGGAYALAILEYLGVTSSKVAHTEQDYAELYADFDALKTRIKRAINFLESGNTIE